MNIMGWGWRTVAEWSKGSELRENLPLPGLGMSLSSSITVNTGEFGRSNVYLMLPCIDFHAYLYNNIQLRLLAVITEIKNE